MTKPRSTLVLMPLSGSRLLTQETAAMLEAARFLFAKQEVRFDVQWLAGYDQAQARDELLAYFWQATDFEDALFVDNDMRVDPRYLLHLASLTEPLLCIPYEMRNNEGKTGMAKWAIDTQKDGYSETREGVQMMPVAGAGMGLTRIRRQAYDRMIQKYGSSASLNWTSHYERWPGLHVSGLCTPMVTEHPAGSGVQRRRGEDMSFFWRAKQAGLQLYAMVDVPVWHDARGGRSLRDAWQEEEKRVQSLRKRAHAELAQCPDTLLGLVEVLDGAYDILGLEFDDPPVILDIGANIGAFAIWAAKRYPNARITCFEPHPEMAELARYNTGHGAWPGIDVRTAAVVGGVEANRMRLYDGPNNPGERTLKPVAGVHLETYIEVDTVSARKLPPCEVLKVDTEGCEREILESYPYLTDVKAIMLEWHTVADYQWAQQALRERGFVCMVDRARGGMSEHRELCFVRKGFMKV